MNMYIVAAVTGWFCAQGIKFSIHLIKNRQIDFYYFVSTGGMPSAHSASVSALATSVGLGTGFTNAPFAVAFTLAAVVMFDAQSVRLAAGHQARILNQMAEQLFKDHHWPHGKLKELLGHTRKEVLAGMGLGIILAWLIQAAQ